MGAEGFEPPSTGFHHAESDSARSDMGHRSSYSSLVSKPNGNHSHNWSPLGYQTTPYPRFCTFARKPLLLPEPLSSLAPSHLLLAPLPALLSTLLPRSRTSFHESDSLCDYLGVHRFLFICLLMGRSGPVGNFGRLCAFRTRDHWLSSVQHVNPRRPVLYPD